MIQKIHAFINKEIKEENEPKETAVLIRMLCLIDIVFLSVNAVMFGIVCGSDGSLPAAALMLLMIGVFVLSYYSKMNVLVYLYYVTWVANIIVLVLLFGVGFGFRAQIYFMFMVFFYRGAGKPAERVLAVIASGIILCGVTLYNGFNGNLMGIDPTGLYHINIICMTYAICKSTCIAYFFRKKFSASEEKIIRYSKKLEMLATTDPLTKLQNRRGMLNHIEDYSNAISSTSGGLLTIAIGDIDFFKHINDTYGHDAGDYVLETLAKIMNEFMDGKGMVARWGGEEFLFSLENINGDYAFEEMSKLLHLIERYEFSFEGTPINVTMTFGLEEYDDNIGIDKVITKADEKLYMGKEQGRNRVIY